MVIKRVCRRKTPVRPGVLLIRGILLIGFSYYYPPDCDDHYQWANIIAPAGRIEVLVHNAQFVLDSLFTIQTIFIGRLDIPVIIQKKTRPLHMACT